MIMRLSVVVLSFVFSPSFASTVAACTSTTCIEGTCLNNECQCRGGYTGDDCSIPYTECEGGSRVCFNGSECVQNNERDPFTLKFKYHCDCSTAFGVSEFAGENCEYDVTANCHQVTKSTITAYCTNGGACVEVLNDVARGHQGCNCVNGYEGLHCQYLAGTAPPEELAAVAELRAARDRSNDLTPVALFFIIVIPMIVVVMFVYFGYQRRKTEKEDAEEMEVGSGSELEIQSPKAAGAEVSREDETRPEII